MRTVRNDSFRYNKRSFESPVLILVEGADEFQFLRFLLPSEDIQIHVYGGKDRLKAVLETIPSIEGYSKIRKVVIMRDGDQNPQGALQSVLSQWANAFKATPPQVQTEEWFSDAKGCLWCVWIIPYEGQEGDLETLLWHAVPVSEHRLCVEEFMRCFEESKLPIQSHTKARLYTWLVTQNDLVKDLYAAFDKRRKPPLFRSDNPVFERLHTLMEQLRNI